MTLGYLTLTPRSRSHEVLPSTLNIMWPMRRQNLKLLLLKHYEEMRFQENTLFDLDLGVKVTGNIAQYPWHHVTYAQAKFEIATSKSLWGDAFTRKYIIWPFDLDLGVKVTRNVTQYPLHHVIYAPTKFQVATSNGLGEDTITRNVTDGQTGRQTDARTDGRRTDFGRN